MDILFSDGPIVACSTSLASNAAINLVRLSGFRDLGSIGPLLDFDVQNLKPRYAHFARIKNLAGTFIDEVVLTYFPAPKSYTGENILEIAVHGNILNTNEIVELFAALPGFRKALPGEFSYRAFKNKKISLSQIEGLDSLLNAKTKNVMEQGRSLISGELNQAYLNLYENFLEHKACLELSTDFYEDVGEEVANDKLEKSFAALEKNIRFLYSRAADNYQSLKDPSIALIGKPNAGKSSLFNLLLAEDRAIVSDEKGTTRDFLTERIMFGENSFRLIDTAGLRTTENKIERAGIEKSYQVIKNSFFKILLINPFDEHDDFETQLKSLTPDLVLFTHADLKDFSEKQLPFSKMLGSIGPLTISLVDSKKNTNLNKIHSLVIGKYMKLLKNNPILIERQVESIKNIYSKFTAYERVFAKNAHDVGILSSEFNILGKKIAELIGIVSPDDVLHHIFANFCIGK
ncbi:MAG: tRNA uridine-5-carboxymethylaminomethyl(34) synthesis GTPase MnmE [Bacteriovoracaceae bacterium]|nr:tRNA uridine-5-carboxymethylaminomethyl(34) synthesis GTPase MnmE [Bacteriovoracaceae bacterium]